MPHGVERRSFVSYIDKSREYYAAAGYETPYRWAHHSEVPFGRLPAGVSEAKVGIVTTSYLHERDRRDKAAHCSFAQLLTERPEHMFTNDLAWDKDATHTNDPETYLPLRAAQALVDSGKLGSLSHRFYGVPTEYSQRQTREIDAPATLKFIREDGVDAVVLVPL